MNINKKGFTLIEILSVVVILGISFMFIIPSLTSLIGMSEKTEIELIEEKVLIAAKEYVDNINGTFYKSFYKEGDVNYIYKSDLITADLIDEKEISKLDTFAGVKGELLSNDRMKYTVQYINVSSDRYTNEELYNMIQNLTDNEKEGSSIIENIEKQIIDINMEIDDINSNINNVNSNISNMTNKNSDANIFLKMYPVGSVYVNSTNTNPSTMFGGEWELVHKNFGTAYKSTNLFVPTDKISYSFVDLIRNGTVIRLRLQLKLANDMSETNTELGTLDYSEIGILKPTMSYFNHWCASEDGNGAVLIKIENETGVVTAIDYITKTADSSFQAEKGFTCDFTFPIRISDMLDYAVSEFHFKRIA